MFTENTGVLTVVAISVTGKTCLAAQAARKAPSRGGALPPLAAGGAARGATRPEGSESIVRRTWDQPKHKARWGGGGGGQGGKG